MKHVRFGNTGLKVSKLCLGTMTFGLQCDEATSVAILDRAAQGGMTFIDTADVYPLGSPLELVGRTEEIVGRWLRGKREQFILATKCGFDMGPLDWQRGASRKHVLHAVDASLKRLGTDYVDLYQVHHPDADTPMDETLGPSTPFYAAAKPVTSAVRIIRPGDSPVPWAGAKRWDSINSSPRSRATIFSSGKTSGNCSRCAGRRESLSFRTTRWREGC